MTEIKRCGWCSNNPLLQEYHDKEWGRLVTSDHKMFELLTLVSAQSGLSGLSIMHRRENYRWAFADFDVERVAKFNDDDIMRILAAPGIIQNSMKIKAAITNAQRFINIQQFYGSFCKYLRSFLPNGEPIINQWERDEQIPKSSSLSDAVSKSMRRRGFKFFGTITCYAHLQAVGYVNDHLRDCHFKFEH